MIKKGFTLAEVMISIGILLVLFVLFTQSYLFLVKTVRNIEVNRELSIHTATIVNTLSTDIDRFEIDTSNSNTKTLVLTHPHNRSHTVTYSFNEILGSSAIQTLFPDRYIDNITRLSTLERKEENTLTGELYVDTLSHSAFGITNFYMEQFPNPVSTSPCNQVPRTQMYMDITYIPKTANDPLIRNSETYTTFTSPEDPLTYSLRCNGSL